MADIVIRGGSEDLEPELLEFIISSLGVNSTPKKVPLKAVSNLGKMLGLILPKNTSKIVIVLSRDHLGSENTFASAAKSAFSGSSVTVLFSHKLDKDNMLVYFK
ncbi:DUF4898 domain-containing protein [Metallosphaera hakonensis]|nr:DUF4898 domain-containing protein [Metallosphaera hakonensis]